METVSRHWTAKSSADFVYRIVSDFIAQIETRVEDEDIEKQELARRLGASPGYVSQLLTPGNFTVDTMVNLAKALGMKVAIVAYDDDDPLNEKGPINSTIFVKAWTAAGKPRDAFSFSVQTVGSESKKPVASVLEFVSRDFVLRPEEERTVDLG